MYLLANKYSIKFTNKWYRKKGGEANVAKCKQLVKWVKGIWEGVSYTSNFSGNLKHQNWKLKKYIYGEEKEQNNSVILSKFNL